MTNPAAMKTADELTLQELALVVVRHEGIEYYIGASPFRPGEILAVNLIDGGEYEINWQTIGPLWGREAPDYLDYILKQYDAMEKLPWDTVLAEIVAISRSPASMARALVSLWFHDGVPEDMLK